MLSEMLEIIFENISKENIFKVLYDIIENDKNIIDSNIVENDENDEITEKFILENETVDKIINLFINNRTNLLIINISSIILSDNNKLENCSINIKKKLKSNFNLEISFYSDETTVNNLKDLFDYIILFCNKISTKYDINKYYCGLEPAIDDNKIIFTNSGFRKLYHEIL